MWRLTAFVADPENPDVIGRGYFQMLKWETHPVRLAKSASFGQHADIDLAAHVVGDRVQLAMAHNDAPFYFDFL